MKVKVCPKCYNLDKDKLENTADKFDIKMKFGCIKECTKEKKDKIKAKIKGEIIKFDNQDELENFIKENA